MFYDRFKLLCEQANVSCKKAVIDIGLSNSIATKWKKTGATPNGETLLRIANYFGTTVESLLETENKPVAITGSELDIKDIINNMSREELVEFILIASARLKDLD